MKYLTLFCMLILGVSACQQTEIVEPDRYLNTPEGNFEALWNGLNRRYAFWDQEKTDWNQIYNTYRPKVTASTADEELKKIFSEMTGELIDGHFSIAYQDGTFYLPKLEDLIKNSLPADHYKKIIPERYLSGYRSTTDSVHFMGYIPLNAEKKIQYLRIGEFDLSTRAFAGSAADQAFLQQVLLTLQQPEAATKGIIVDIRQNKGGDAADLSLLGGLFTDKFVQVGWVREKLPGNRFNFTPYIPFGVQPARESSANQLPLVVLCDHNSISMAELTTMYMSLLPQATIVGDITFGANGPRTSKDLSGAGPFSLPNGAQVTIADRVFKFIDGKVYEGIGFQPDLMIKFDKNRPGKGDNQLDKALELLN